MAERLSILLATLLVIAQLPKPATAGEESSSLVSLSARSFDIAVSGNKAWLLMFGSPACPHCVRVVPTLEKLAAALDKDGTNIGVGKIDCTQDRQLCKRFQVKSYPTILFLDSNKKTYAYDGSRELSDLLEFVKGGYGGAKLHIGNFFSLKQRLKGLAGGLVFSALQRAQDAVHAVRAAWGWPAAVVLCTLGLTGALFGTVLCIVNCGHVLAGPAKRD